jgi:hypothetical protein
MKWKSKKNKKKLKSNITYMYDVKKNKFIPQNCIKVNVPQFTNTTKYTYYPSIFPQNTI